MSSILHVCIFNTEPESSEELKAHIGALNFVRIVAESAKPDELAKLLHDSPVILVFFHLDPLWAHAAIDFVGTPQTAAPALAALRKGGRYILVGLHGGELAHPMPPIAQRAIGIVGSYVGNLAELKQVVALAKKKKLRPLPIETRPAERANDSLQDLLAGKVPGRIVLNFEGVAA